MSPLASVSTARDALDEILQILPLVVHGVDDILARSRASHASSLRANDNVSARPEALDIQHVLADYDNIIIGINIAVCQLTSCNARIQASRSDYSRLVSRVGRLPSEVLGEIFHFALPTHLERVNLVASTDNTPGVVPLVSTGAQLSLNVAQVCRRWRTIALSTPQLWNEIAINLTNKPRSHLPPAPIELLARSRVLPVSLIVNITGTTGNDMFALLSELAETFERRCVSVEVIYNQMPGFPGLLRRLAHPSGLRRLGLTGTNVPSSIGSELAEHKQLSQLFIATLGWSFDPSAIFTSRWTALTSLNIVYHTLRHELPETVYCVFLAAPNLAELFITRQSDPVESAGPIQLYSILFELSYIAPFICPKLQRLALDLNSADETSSLFEVMTCPALSDLQITGQVYQFNLDSFLARSPSLARLALFPREHELDQEIMEHVSRTHPKLSSVGQASNVDDVRRIAPAWYAISSGDAFRVDT